MMNRLRKVAGVLVSAAPLALVSAPSHASGGGIDVSAVTTAIAGASAPIAAIGAAVLVVLVGVAIYKWIRRAL